MTHHLYIKTIITISCALIPVVTKELAFWSRCLSHPKMLDESVICCHKVWVTLFMCLCTSPEKHVAVSQPGSQFVCDSDKNHKARQVSVHRFKGGRAMDIKKYYKRAKLQSLWEVSHCASVAKTTETPSKLTRTQSTVKNSIKQRCVLLDYFLIFSVRPPSWTHTIVVWSLLPFNPCPRQYINRFV